MAAWFAGARKRQVREHNERMQAAWITARLTAYPPAKPRAFTRLDKLLVSEGARQQRRRQTWQQQLAISAGWVA